MPHRLRVSLRAVIGLVLLAGLVGPVAWHHPDTHTGHGVAVVPAANHPTAPAGGHVDAVPADDSQGGELPSRAVVAVLPARPASPSLPSIDCRGPPAGR